MALPLVAYPGARLAACLIGCLGVGLAAPPATCLAAHAGTRLTAPSVAYLDACLIGGPDVGLAAFLIGFPGVGLAAHPAIRLAAYLATCPAAPSVAHFHANLAARSVAHRSARQPVLPAAYSTRSLPRKRTLRFYLTY